MGSGRLLRIAAVRAGMLTMVADNNGSYGEREMFASARELWALSNMPRRLANDLGWCAL